MSRVTIRNHITGAITELTITERFIALITEFQAFIQRHEEAKLTHREALAAFEKFPETLRDIVTTTAYAELPTLPALFRENARFCDSGYLRRNKKAAEGMNRLRKRAAIAKEMFSEPKIAPEPSLDLSRLQNDPFGASPSPSEEVAEEVFDFSETKPPALCASCGLPNLTPGTLSPYCRACLIGLDKGTPPEG